MPVPSLCDAISSRNGGDALGSDSESLANESGTPPTAGSASTPSIQRNANKKKDPTNVLLIKEAQGRLSTERLQEVLEGDGRDLIFLKVMAELHRALAVFFNTEEAIAAQKALKDLDIEATFGKATDRETILKLQLAPPPPERAFLISPPPSPPETWRPRWEHRPAAASPDDHVHCEQGHNKDITEDTLRVLLRGDSGRGQPAITLFDFDASP